MVALTLSGGCSYAMLARLLGRADLVLGAGNASTALLLGTNHVMTLRDPIKKSRVEWNGHVLESRPKIVLLLHRRISIQLLLVWHLLRTGTRNPDAIGCTASGIDDPIRTTSGNYRKQPGGAPGLGF